jgi:hypothetical protein
MLILSTKVLILLHVMTICVCDKPNNELVTKLKTDKKLFTDLTEKKKNVIYEDITIMDDDGQLKNLKIKSANKKSQSISDSNKVNHVEYPVTENSVKYHVNSEGGTKLKFFDELQQLGCKYLYTY